MPGAWQAGWPVEFFHLPKIIQNERRLLHLTNTQFEVDVFEERQRTWEMGSTQTPGHFFCITMPPEILRFLVDMLKMLPL